MARRLPWSRLCTKAILAGMSPLAGDSGRPSVGPLGDSMCSNWRSVTTPASFPYPRSALMDWNPLSWPGVSTTSSNSRERRSSGMPKSMATGLHSAQQRAHPRQRLQLRQRLASVRACSSVNPVSTSMKLSFRSSSGRAGIICRSEGTSSKGMTYRFSFS